MRRRAQERARVAEAEIREAKRSADAEAREAKRVADTAIREAEREAREIARIRDREAREAQREAERAAELRHATAERMSFGHYVATGVAAGVSAHGVISMAEKGAEAGSDLQDARLGLAQTHISPQMAADIERRSLALSTRYANVSQTAVMEISKEALSVLQDPDELGPVVETLTAAKSILDANDKSGKSSEGLGMLVKGSESIGAAKDPARFRKLIDAYVKANQVMGHTINPEQIFEFDKMLKTAGARASDRFLMTTGLSLAQEMRGDSAGTGIAAAEKSIATGFGKNHQSVRNMASVGLIAPQDVDYLKGTHEAKGLKPGRHMVGADVAASDLDLWVYDTLLPALEKHGMKTEGSQLDFVMRTFTGTGADVISKMITQRGAFEKDARKYQQASGISWADNWDSASKGLTAFNTALGNLAANATSPMMGAAGRSLYAISRGLNHLSELAADHPAVAATTAVGLTGGALYGSGRLAMSVLNGGFGLTSSAEALKVAAAAQSEAAAALSRAAGVETAAAEKQALANGGVAGATGASKTSALNIVANSVALFGLAKVAESYAGF